MKKPSKKSKTLRIRYYIETERGNSLYRVVQGQCPEFKNDTDPGWTNSEEYLNEDHLKSSRTTTGSNWGVEHLPAIKAKAIITRAA